MPPSTAAAPSSPPAAPGITSAAADLIQLDPLGHSAVRAPSYSLTDQSGRTITPDSFHGRSVVLTFNDDQCQDLCTLLAQDVARADTDLGSQSGKIAFVSINANPYYPAVTDVAQWTDAHGLGHAANWYYGTGSPKTLAAVAQAYGVPIELDPAQRSVVHGTEIFFIDPSGTERALGQFGTDSASTAAFAHTMAQEAVDLLPSSERGTVSGAAPADLGTTGTGVGSKPAPFSLPALDGSGRNSSSTGAYTVLNFWASTCTACVTELPALQKVAQEFSGRAAFLGIDVSDQTPSARSLAARSGVTYPLAADADGVIAGRFHITGLPYTVVLDPSGRVLIRHPGAFTAEQLEYILQTLMPASGSKG
nr:redoxin domain-containing protein [Leifsonia sp. C5G2]